MRGKWSKTDRQKESGEGARERCEMERDVSGKWRRKTETNKKRAGEMYLNETLMNSSRIRPVFVCRPTAANSCGRCAPRHVHAAGKRRRTIF